MKYLLADATKQKARVHQLDFIGAFLKAKVNNRVFLKLDSRYVYYSPEYSEYFGRTFILLKSVYVMTNSGKLFDYELTEWLLVAGLIKSKCQMSIYYMYAPDGTNIVVFNNVDHFVYWYTFEAIGKSIEIH